MLIPSKMDSKEITLVLRDGYEVAVLCDGFVHTLEELELDFLLIDTHPGLNEETLLAMTVSDHLIVALRPDEQDLLGTAIILEVARKLGITSITSIVNKVLDRYNTAELKTQIEKSFDTPVSAVLPVADELIALGSKEIFAQKYPDHKITQELAKTASLLVKERELNPQTTS